MARETVARSVLIDAGVSDLFSTIAPLHTALDYHLDRHNVLATNVAHVDTPGFRPKDLSRATDVDFGAVLNVTMERTNGAHLAAAGDAGTPRSGRIFEDASAGAGNDGNYVSLDREAAKVAANQLRYDVVSAIATAELKQLHFAANDGRG